MCKVDLNILLCWSSMPWDWDDELCTVCHAKNFENPAEFVMQNNDENHATFVEEF